MALATMPVTLRQRHADSARRLADVIRRQVLDDTWPSGVLPADAALASTLGTDRATVRDALDLLRAEGIVERLPGVGTVVVRTHDVGGLDRLRGLVDSTGGSGTTVVRVLSLQRAPLAVQARLGLQPDDDVLHIERVHLRDGVPRSLHLTYLVLDVARYVLGRDLTDVDLLALVEEATGRRLGHADLRLELVGADAHTSAALGTGRGAALMLLERLTHLDDGRPVELEFVRFRSDSLSVRATTYRGEVLPR